MNPVDIHGLFKAHLAKLLLEQSAPNDPAMLDELEDSAAELYMEWARTPCEALGGSTPQGYFAGMAPHELICNLREYFASDTGIPDVLLDAIVDARPENELESLLFTSEPPRLRLQAADLLVEIGSGNARKALMRVLERESDEQLIEKAAQAMGGESVAELKRILGKCSPRAKECILDIISEYDACEETFRLVEAELLLPGCRVQLYAPMLARFGPAAVGPLKEALGHELGYLDYLAVRDALEMLGETVGERDFAGDPDYEAVCRIERRKQP